MPFDVLDLLLSGTLSAGGGAAIGLRFAGVSVALPGLERTHAKRDAPGGAHGAAAASAGRPSGTVTMLFTDIEGSTRLLQRHPERYGDLLAQHQRLLRGAFDAHDGCEIGTLGDGFFVVFGRARDAVSAAV